MTAGRYAPAAGLVERAAAAFVAAVPGEPTDDGFFGPGSVAWRISADLTTPVAGLRALLVQALHPLAMAGVDQHSDWRADPVGRLAATSGYLTSVVFGRKADAEKVSARVRTIHQRVTGTDPVTGRDYQAGDPRLLLWVHAALVDSDLATRRILGTPLSGADADHYVAEMVAAAVLVGVPRDMVPADAAALDRYITATRPDLRCTAAAAESMRYLLDPAGLDPDVAEIWSDIRDGVLAVLPGWALEMYGRDAAGPLSDARRTEIRQALGVLDVLFLGEPGVLEARQRIALAIRAAGRQ